jgi:cytoskeletal protein RodZ
MNQPTDLPILPEDANTPNAVTVVDLTEPQRPLNVVQPSAAPIVQPSPVGAPIGNGLPPLQEAVTRPAAVGSGVIPSTTVTPAQPQVRRQFPLSEMAAIQAPISEVARPHLPPVSAEVAEIIKPKQRKADFNQISQPHISSQARIGLFGIILVLVVLAGFLAVNILNTPAAPTDFAVDQQDNQQNNQPIDQPQDTEVSNQLEVTGPEELDNNITLPETTVATENTPPTVTIVTPEVAGQYIATEVDGEYIAMLEFNGNATDEQDGGLTGNSLVWSIKQNGGALEQIGTGINITYPLTAPQCENNYEVHLVATDSQGLISSSMLTMSVTRECSE